MSRNARLIFNIQKTKELQPTLGKERPKSRPFPMLVFRRFQASVSFFVSYTVVLSQVFEKKEYPKRRRAREVPARFGALRKLCAPPIWNFPHCVSYKCFILKNLKKSRLASV